MMILIPMLMVYLFYVVKLVNQLLCVRFVPIYTVQLLFFFCFVLVD